MESGPLSTYSCCDLVFTVVGVCCYLLDVGSDLWVAAELYVAGEVFWFGLVLGSLALASVLVHTFSWLWFIYDRELEGFETQTSAEKILFGREGILQLSLLHVFQLGVLFRHLSAVELGLCVWWFGKKRLCVWWFGKLTILLCILLHTNQARTMQCELTILLCFLLHTNQARTMQCEYIYLLLHTNQACSVHLPNQARTMQCEYIYLLCFLLHPNQARTMQCEYIYLLCFLLHPNQARTMQSDGYKAMQITSCHNLTKFGARRCVSIAASSASISWTVLMYHRSLRSFLVDKTQQSYASSALYFLWNLLLIAPRVAALALLGSALPCLVPAHFLCLWLPLFLWAWLQRTDFMDSVGGEWLYRGAVALVWYFSWFSVAEGRSRGRSLIYHAFMAADGALLLAVWWTLRDEELTQAYAAALLISLPAAHVLGLLLKALYYCCLHPTLHTLPTLPNHTLHTLHTLPVQREEDVPDTAASFRSLPPQAGPSHAHTTPPTPAGPSHSGLDPPTPASPLPLRAGPSSQLCNKRMASLANIFYTKVPPLPHVCLPSSNKSSDVI
ncbi:hypothetical protein AAFF_G00267060 [Aldrovandia affinis]|uniref:XK-related protein n=1 Tax=Aldrovandia affinis TaxID=143900 RepID=A0AAD7RB72_9TELE|nr:hypothetical protein AAFF_G00267060 [Aldrovandia affinis]